MIKNGADRLKLLFILDYNVIGLPSFQMYSVNLTYEIVNCQYTNNLYQDPFLTQSRYINI